MTGPDCLIAVQLFISLGQALDDNDRDRAVKFLDRYTAHRERCSICSRRSVDVETPQ
jgi:hypothetical protein